MHFHNTDAFYHFIIMFVEKNNAEILVLTCTEQYGKNGTYLTRKIHITYAHTVDILYTIFQVNLQIQGTHTHTHILQHTDNFFTNPHGNMLPCFCIHFAVLFIPFFRPLKPCHFELCMCWSKLLYQNSPPSLLFFYLSVCANTAYEQLVILIMFAKNAWIYGFKWNLLTG